MQAVRVGEIATNLGDLLKQVQRGEVEDDLDNGRLKLAKAPESALLKHVAAVKSQQPNPPGPLPDAQASRPALISLFPELSKTRVK